MRCLLVGVLIWLLTVAPVLAWTPATQAILAGPQVNNALVQKGAAIDLNFQRGGQPASGGVCAWWGHLTSCYKLTSITRASTGYAQTAAGLLVPFNNNVLRITDLGLLIEESRTNLVLQSQTFGTTWVVANVTVTDNTSTAPDGTTTADTLTDNAVNSAHGITENLTTTGGSTYSYTVYAKAGTGAFINLRYSSAITAGHWITAIFDLGNPSATAASQTAVGATSGTIVTTTQTSLGNGWWRLSLVGSIALTDPNILIGFAPAATGNTFTTFGRPDNFSGTGTTTLILWGAQLELGSFPTSYIPTTTASATRAADNITATGALVSPFNTQETSFVLAWNTPIIPAAGARLFDNNGSTQQNLMTIGGVTGVLATVLGGSTVATANAMTVNVTNKGGYSFGGAGRSTVLNNGVVATGTAQSIVAGTPTLGSSTATANRYLNGYLQRLTAWSSRLPDATLKALTQ